jgi:hypothetical protein
MTGHYLEKLKALKTEKRASGVLTKPTKHSLSVADEQITIADGGFVSFVSTQGMGFSKLPEPYGRTIAALESRCPDLVPAARWQHAVEDGVAFLTRWGDQAEALGWTTRDLFGLDTPPAKPHPSYSRLSRYDETGLIWLLQGRPVVALTEATAAIQSSTGAITIYRRHNKPALGPEGDNLDDLEPPFDGRVA